MINPWTCLRTVFDQFAPAQGISSLAIIYCEKQGQRHYLFAAPSTDEIKRNKKGLRLFGGMGEARETPLDTLFRELREEIIGHDAMSLYDQTGSDDHLSSAQKDVLCLLNQKKMETANAFGKSAIWSHSYAFKPNRFHPVQENWTRSVNHVFGLKFTAEELDKIAAVGTATTKYDQKELSGIEILGEKDLKRNIAKDPDFMGYKGEQKSLSLFMGNAGKIDPSPSLAAA